MGDELGYIRGFSLYPVYFRGQAYLMAQKGGEAAGEFQKMLDHPGIVLDSPIRALAHLGLARAYALQGDTLKARAKYEDFLKLWKDADPDILILIGAPLAAREERVPSGVRTRSGPTFLLSRPRLLY